MLDSLNQLGGFTTQRPTIPAFGRYALPNLLRERADGFAWAKGVHVYSELRLAVDLKLADSDESAQKYLNLIEEYTHAGIVAARIFGLELLELQNNVLHFHKDGDNVEEAGAAALQFSYVFMKVLYETLAEDLGSEWHGVAVCMDHGDSIIIHRGQASNSSTVSLGPSANRPAKRLLYDRTAAGHAEIPGSWVAQLFGRPSREAWYAINLRDSGRLPNFSSLENADLEGQLRRAMGEYRSRQMLLGNRHPFVLANAKDLVDRGNFSTENPLRMEALCMRVDLDRFTAMVEEAFHQGDQAVEKIANGFLRILEFGDHFEKTHYGVIRLPWAGDCVSFLIPLTGDINAFRGQAWVSFVEEWQTFASNTDAGRKSKWGNIFMGISWSVGLSYAEDGLCLVAPVSTESRKFLVGAGAPLTLAHDAQNLGKGGETVIHANDYNAAYPIVRTLFSKIFGTDFWRGQEITMKKVTDAAIKAGRSENASKIEIVQKAASITIPPPRPYCF